MVPNAAVIEVGTPVKSGEARGAFSASALVNPALTIEPPTNKLPLNELSEATERPAFKETSPAEMTTPVNDGAARGALSPRAELNPVFTIDPLTNKLPLKDESEATERPAFKETSPALTIMPVKEGEARGALRDNELVNPVLTIDPPTYNPLLNELSEATERPAFNETSPAEMTTPVNDGAARGALRDNELVNPEIGRAHV